MTAQNDINRMPKIKCIFHYHTFLCLISFVFAMASGIQHPNEGKWYATSERTQKKEKENLYGASTVNSNI